MPNVGCGTCILGREKTKQAHFQRADCICIAREMSIAIRLGTERPSFSDVISDSIDLIEQLTCDREFDLIREPLREQRSGDLIPVEAGTAVKVEEDIHVNRRDEASLLLAGMGAPVEQIRVTMVAPKQADHLTFCPRRNLSVHDEAESLPHRPSIKVSAAPDGDASEVARSLRESVDEQASKATTAMLGVNAKMNDS